MKKKNLVYLASTAILLAATAQYVQADETSSLFTNPKPREEVAEQTKEMIQDSSQEQGSQTSTTPDKTVETETPNVPTELSLAQGSQPSTLDRMPEEKGVSEKDAGDSSKPTSPSLTKGQSTFYTAGDASRTKRSASQATVKTQTFVDVSSHNGTLSEAD